jgi:hypothetical protein
VLGIDFGDRTSTYTVRNRQLRQVLMRGTATNADAVLSGFQQFQPQLMVWRQGRIPDGWQAETIFREPHRERVINPVRRTVKGTVLKRIMKGGKNACACHSDPDKRYGPYFELTYKANGKTVNVKLAPEAAPLYKAASLQYRRLKLLLTRLEKLSQIILRNQAKKAYRPQR